MAVGVDGSAPVPAAPRVRPRSGNARRLWVVGAIIVAALGFLVFRGLNNATLYFRTADEAVAKRNELGTHRFRIESKGTIVDVVHRGNQPGLFKPGIPVVLEGRFAAGSQTFDSDRILVKHSESYVAKNPERVTTTVPAP